MPLMVARVLMLCLAVAAASQSTDSCHADSFAMQVGLLVHTLSPETQSAECKDNDEAARATAGTVHANVTGCADVAPMCSDPEVGPTLWRLCCDTCQRGCTDNDVAAKEQAGDAGLKIRGCSDLSYLCDDPFASTMVKSLCCATCSAPKRCTDADGMVAAQAAASGVHISGCRQVAHLCDDESVGHMVSSLCCASCSNDRSGKSASGAEVTATGTSAPAPSPPSPKSPKIAESDGHCGVKGVDDTPWRRMPKVKAGKIVNGQTTSHCEWKWQACIMEAGKGSGQCWCGGTLVADRWVISAAHCFVEHGSLQPASAISVTLGEWEHFAVTDGTEAVHEVSKIIIHEGYDEVTTENDIALLKLAQPADMGDCIGTACLPEQDIEDGSLCFVTGWGTLRSGGKAPQILQEAEVTTLSNHACGLKYAEGQITDAMFCANGDKGGIVDACQGDSGGPLVCESDEGIWTLMGVVSWGKGCADASFPGVYARVFHFMDWINSSMQSTPSAAASGTTASTAYDGASAMSSSTSGSASTASRSAASTASSSTSSAVAISSYNAASVTTLSNDASTAPSSTSGAASTTSRPAVSTSSSEKQSTKAVTTTSSASQSKQSVHAMGDPHMVNVHGQHFDLMKPGKHTLIQMPKGATAQDSMLLVGADASRVGLACGDMYILALNVTGKWAEEKQRGGFHFVANSSQHLDAKWLQFGKVQLKVVRGRTSGGTAYLNVLARSLSKAGMRVGGLLGEDDHTAAATPNPLCLRRLVLASFAPNERMESSASEAKASW